MASEPAYKSKKNKDLTEEDLKQKWADMLKSCMPFDPRFPNTHQTRNCKQNYVDYYHCVHKTNDENYCDWYKRQYKTICPEMWIEKWDEQRANGTWAPDYTVLGKELPKQ